MFVRLTTKLPDAKTVIVGVCCRPGCQKMPLTMLLESTTLSPAQKVVGPPAVITASGGTGRYPVVTVAEGADWQPNSVTVTVQVPGVETVIDCVVAPFDHRLPVALLEVKVTSRPGQKVVGPLEVTVGVGGIGFTVTVTTLEVSETQFPSSTTTE